MSLWRIILLAVNLLGVRFGGAAIGLEARFCWPGCSPSMMWASYFWA